MKHLQISPVPLALSCLLAFAAAPLARAAVYTQDQIISDRTVMTAASRSVLDYYINDGVTLTFTGTFDASGGMFDMTAGTTLTIGPNPDAADLTGFALFKDIWVTGHAAGIRNTGGLVRLTNARFENVHGQAVAVAGAFFNNATTSLAYLDHVDFVDCYSGNAGAIRNSGTLTLTDGSFVGNYANYDGANGYAGAFHNNGAAANTVLTRVAFTANRARNHSGAIYSAAGALTMNNVTFNDNWAGTLGGALRVMNTVTLNLTQQGAVSRYDFTGNFAGSGTDVRPIEDVQSGSASFAPAAAGGGFLYAGSVNTKFYLNIGAGVTLAIGDTDGADKAVDSIASGVVTSNIYKEGAGDLILNADNSWYSANTTVSAGRLLLGNDGAKLGGKITVAGGATFGGAGTLTTSGTVTTTPTASVTVAAGATLQVGLADRATEKLSINGNLALADSTLAFVAFGGTHATKLEALSYSGTAPVKVDLQGFSTGTYNLGSFASGTVPYSFLLNGVAAAPGGRQTVTDVSSGGSLIVDYYADTARVMTWTGASGNIWDGAANNWQGSAAATKFAGGDAVVFNAAVDSTIAITNSARVSGIVVDGAAVTTFLGGGIIATAYAGGDAEAAVLSAGGRLVKKGAGTLVLANEDNVFHGGIELAAGALEFSRAGQIQTGTAALRVTGSATLRARGGADIETVIELAGAGIAMEMDTGTSTVRHTLGKITGAGSLLKTGAGALVLATANDYAGGTTLREGVLRIADRRALGTGALVVGSTGAVLELDGEFSAGNAIDLGGRALEVRNAGAAAATLAGSISNGSLVIGAGGAGAVNLAGNNAFSTLQVRSGARAAVIGARGIAGAHATVNTGGRLDVRTTGVQAAQITVQPGAVLSFADIKTTSPFLVVDHLLVLEDQSVVALAKAPSSKLWLAATGDGVLDNGARLDVGPRTSDFDLLVEGNNLYAVNINWAANPGRDIVAAFDALAALTGAVYSRLDEGFIQPLVARRPGAPENGFWFKGFASIADYDGGDGRIGHKDDTRGGMAGYDKMLSEHLLLGGHLGYSRSSIKTGNGSVTDADQPWLGLYGAMKFGAFYFAADLAAGSVDADTMRPEGAGNFVSGSYKAVTLGGGGEIGLILPLWSRATLKPAAAVHYMNYAFKDHGESAPQGIGAVIVDDFTTDQVEGLASLQFTQQFTTPWKTPGMFNLLAGWRCALKDEATVLSARFAEDVNESVTILGDVYDRDRLNLGFGLRVALTGSAFLTLAYDYEIGKDLDRSTVSLGASWSW
ncbi:autotransporter domain-containing protein [Termitidicoccus mucosus]|uniref:Autotransporter domain-containing protein n=1 Tax=Termitidicoccus mucosus TaxID=1184151 RepID=A0A178IEQ4_9BACT|nr:hypothetical protein AW736_18730 [Opitutaceae bacterium TSB47]